MTVIQKDRMPWRKELGVLSFLGILVVSGCQQEGIRRYQVPKNTTRLLGVIVSQPDRIWFFKLAGPAKVVGSHEKDFESFIQSVRFTGNENRPVEWDVPADWKEEAGSSFLRYATFRLGAGSQSLEMTVTPLGREAASVIDNVNRWRSQIGLAPVEEKDLGQVTKELTINGIAATWVDMSNTIR